MKVVRAWICTKNEVKQEFEVYIFLTLYAYKSRVVHEYLSMLLGTTLYFKCVNVADETKREVPHLSYLLIQNQPYNTVARNISNLCSL